MDSFADDWSGHRDVRGQLERGATKWASHGVSEQVDGSLAQVPALEPIGEMQDELYPPKNFAMVYQGVFRSAYPTVRRCLPAKQSDDLSTAEPLKCVQAAAVLCTAIHR